jgi:Spo0E like sporulation regulatory protein.
MWDAKIEELRDELNQKVESGISLSEEVLETSKRLDKAINEFYRNIDKENKKILSCQY